MTITGSTIRKNQAIGGDGGNGETALSQGIGGGILNGASSTLTVIGSTIKNNLARGGNNSTPTPDNPLTGGAFGGGIDNIFSGTVTVISSTIANNEARGGNTAHGAGGSAIGGGIDCFSNCKLTLTDCKISNNLADAGLRKRSRDSEGRAGGEHTGGLTGAGAKGSATSGSLGSPLTGKATADPPTDRSESVTPLVSSPTGSDPPGRRRRGADPNTGHPPQCNPRLARRGFWVVCADEKTQLPSLVGTTSHPAFDPRLDRAA